MQSIIENQIDGNGYKLHVVPSKKYKTINIIVKFKAPLSRETITQRALIPFILQKGTVDHPNERELRIALDELYGAVLSIDSSKKGESHIITVRMEIANETYLSTEQQILNKALQLLSEIIFKPKTDDGKFDSTIFQREKQTLKQKIDSIIDDKMSYANMRLIDEMCKDEDYRLHVHGYLEDLEQINEGNLLEYYQKLLVEDDMNIYILGDIESEKIKTQIGQYFSREHSPKSNKQQNVKNNITNIKEIIDKQNIQQGKLHLGYRTNITYNDPEYYALQVFNGIFGGFPSSKLFMNVREKHSLAYYAASRIESHKGLLFVFSGIAPDDYSKAKDIILEQMDSMKKGDFTEDQVDETKNMIINQLQETMDHPQGLIEILYHKVLADSTISPNDVIEGIKRVNKEDLIKIGNDIQLDTIYFLTSKGGSSDE